VQDRREQKESDPETIEQREDTQRTPNVEVTEVVVAMQGIKENSGNEEARKDEEEIDSNPTP